MSKLTKELTLAIRPFILKGVQYIDIQKELGISPGNWDYWYWDNKKIKNHHQGFRDFVKACKHERMLNKADRISDEITNLIAVDENGKTDLNALKIKLDEAKFLRSTLGKIDYSTKVEQDLTSKGEQIQFVLNPDLNNVSSDTKESSSE